MTEAADLVRKWLDLVASGPAEAWADAVAEDIVIRLPFAPPGVAAELRGFDQAFAALGPGWTAYRFNWRDVKILRTEDPELFLSTARSEVAMAGGGLYENSYVILTRVRGGKIVEHVEYFNPLPVMQAFGLPGG